MIWRAIVESSPGRGRAVGKALHAVRRNRRRGEQRENELRQSERRLQALLRNCSDMILVVAPDATVMYHAGSAGLVLGEDPTCAAGTNLTECVDPDDVSRLLELCQTLDTDGAEMQMRYADGSVHLCEVSAAGLIDESAWWGVVLNIRDISERRKLELEREKTAKLKERVAVERERHELEARLLHAQRLESIGALAGGVAHDFNNLLAVIANYVGFIREDLPDDSEVREDVEQVGRAVERGMRLTKQLLAFRKRRTGETQMLDVDEVIGGMQALLARPLGSHIQLGYEPADGLWPVHADPSEVEQIVLNLVVNARDALADGGEITIAAENVECSGDAHGDAGLAPGRYVKISVADTGCGIPADTLEHVWESLFTTKPPDKGTGLGLPTVRGIARKAHGEATISSTVGQGTCVDVFLPTVDGDAPDGAAAAAVPSGG
jgi:two-component system, cell cycle sensor histidine kinase and response regulator CckA